MAASWYHGLLTRDWMNLTFWLGHPPVSALTPGCLPAPPGELCDEVIDHCAPGMNLCQHEAKCISLDREFRWGSFMPDTRSQGFGSNSLGLRQKLWGPFHFFFPHSRCFYYLSASMCFSTPLTSHGLMHCLSLCRRLSLWVSVSALPVLSSFPWLLPSLPSLPSPPSLSAHVFIFFFLLEHLSFMYLFILTPKAANWQCCDSFRRSKGTQSYMHVYPFSPKLPSHPSWHVIVSRVPYSLQQFLASYPF